MPTIVSLYSRRILSSQYTVGNTFFVVKCNLGRNGSYLCFLFKNAAWTGAFWHGPAKEIQETSPSQVCSSYDINLLPSFRRYFFLCCDSPVYTVLYSLNYLGTVGSFICIRRYRRSFIIHFSQVYCAAFLFTTNYYFV